MEEETITTAADDTGASTDAQPVETASPEAVQTTTAPEQQTEQPSEPSEDEQLAKFAESKGLTLDSDNATKAAKMAMNAEKLMHQKTARASELEKSIATQSDEQAEAVAEQTGQDPELLKRLQRVEVKEAVRDFWNTPDEGGSTPDRSLEPAMIKLLETKPHLAGDLESLYASAVVKSGGISAVKSQASRETLEKLAHSQQAAVPTGNATTSGTGAKEKPFAELSIKEMEAKLGYVRR